MTRLQVFDERLATIRKDFTVIVQTEEVLSNSSSSCLCVNSHPHGLTRKRPPRTINISWSANATAVRAILGFMCFCDVPIQFPLRHIDLLAAGRGCTLKRLAIQRNNFLALLKREGSAVDLLVMQIQARP